MWPLKGNVWDFCHLPCHSTTSLLALTARTGDLFSQHWNCGQRKTVWDQDSLTFWGNFHCQFSAVTCKCEISSFCVSVYPTCVKVVFTVFPVIGVLFSDCRWFPMMAFLYFSYNFYVAVRWDKHSIFLLFILIWGFSLYFCQFLFQKNFIATFSTSTKIKDLLKFLFTFY